MVVVGVGAGWMVEGRPAPRVRVEAAAPRARVADPRGRGGARLAAAVAAAKVEGTKVGVMRGPPPCSAACTSHKESAAIIH